MLYYVTLCINNIITYNFLYPSCISARHLETSSDPYDTMAWLSPWGSNKHLRQTRLHLKKPGHEDKTYLELKWIPPSVPISRSLFSSVTLWNFDSLELTKYVSGIHIFSNILLLIVNVLFCMWASLGSTHSWRKKKSILKSYRRKNSSYRQGRR